MEKFEPAKSFNPSEDTCFVPLGPAPVTPTDETESPEAEAFGRLDRAAVAVQKVRDDLEALPRLTPKGRGGGEERRQTVLWVSVGLQ